MPDDTPLSQLVLWVPPALAAAWERLSAEGQAYWSRMIVHGILRYILEPAAPPARRVASLGEIQTMPLEQLKRLVEDLERKFGQQAQEPLLPEEPTP